RPNGQFAGGLMSRTTHLLGLAALYSALSGCALSEKMQKLALSAGQVETEIQARHHAFAQTISSRDARRLAQEVDRPWLAGKSQPLAREVTLPLALRANVDTTFMFS